jgi:hypothetical protein
LCVKQVFIHSEYLWQELAAESVNLYGAPSGGFY